MHAYIWQAINVYDANAARFIVIANVAKTSNTEY